MSLIPAFFAPQNDLRPIRFKNRIGFAGCSITAKTSKICQLLNAMLKNLRRQLLIVKILRSSQLRNAALVRTHRVPISISPLPFSKQNFHLPSVLPLSNPSFHPTLIPPKLLAASRIVLRPVPQVRVRSLDANLGEGKSAQCLRSPPGPALSIPIRSRRFPLRARHNDESCSTSTPLGPSLDRASLDFCGGSAALP